MEVLSILQSCGKGEEHERRKQGSKGRQPKSTEADRHYNNYDRALFPLYFLGDPVLWVKESVGGHPVRDLLCGAADLYVLYR